MKKSEIISIDSNVHFSMYRIKASILGCHSPNPHPWFGHKFTCKKEEITGLRIGDIIRCDGLPFAARPTKVIVKFRTKTHGTIRKRYDPVKISSESSKNVFWALRLCQ